MAFGDDFSYDGINSPISQPKVKTSGSFGSDFSYDNYPTQAPIETTSKPIVPKENIGSKILDFVIPSMGSPKSLIKNVNFEGTKEVAKSIIEDPMNLKSMEKDKLINYLIPSTQTKTAKTFFQNIKDSAVNEWNNLKNLFDKKQTETFTGKIATTIKATTGALGVLLSPITGAFAATEEIPLVGTISKAVFNLPFTALGEGGASVGTSMVDQLPISNKAKEELKPAVGELFALATQIAVGGAIDSAVRTKINSKYGPETAKIMIDKATEMAKDRENHLSTIEKNTKVEEAIKQAQANVEPIKTLPNNSIQIDKTLYRGYDTPNQLKESTNGRYKEGTYYLDTQEGAKAYGERVFEKPTKAKLFDVGNSTEEAKLLKDFGGPNESYDVLQQKIKDEGYDGIKAGTEYFMFKPKENIIEVPRSQLPVGEGKELETGLERRIKQDLDNVPDSIKENISTYNQMNNKEQIAKASEYVIKNPDEALSVLRGEREAPKGLLNNSIAIALRKYAAKEGDVDLVEKLSSLSSTRYGQEIEILKELDPTDPVRYIQDINKIREKKIEKQTGKKISRQKREIVKEIKEKIKKPSKQDWSSFIKSIEC